MFIILILLLLLLLLYTKRELMAFVGDGKCKKL